jgi:hypothetical protein
VPQLIVGVAALADICGDGNIPASVAPMGYWHVPWKLIRFDLQSSCKQSSCNMRSVQASGHSLMRRADWEQCFAALL